MPGAQSSDEAEQRKIKRAKAKRVQQSVSEAEQVEKAKAKDKRGAMMALKSKKMLTAELETLGQARLTLEQQIMTLESSGLFHLCGVFIVY